MNKSKGGKLPMSQKKNEVSDLFIEDDSILALDPEIAREIESKGFAFRWINAGKYRAGGNFHKSGWRAYRRETKKDESPGSLDFNYGTSPEGYIIRNDLLLAVKPKEAHERKLARVRQKAEMMAGVEKRRASELREHMKNNGLGTKVFEGYEGNGDGSDDE